MARIKKAQAGISAKAKRVGPVDPMGAWTKVQEMNLPPKNIKTSASLTKNKMQGATTMAKKGAKVGRSEKQMGLHHKSAAHKEINPAMFRKAQMSRESELMGKQSGEQAPMKTSKKK
jgi:hypothetical protein